MYIDLLPAGQRRSSGPGPFILVARPRRRRLAANEIFVSNMVESSYTTRCTQQQKNRARRLLIARAHNGGRLMNVCPLASRRGASAGAPAAATPRTHSTQVMLVQFAPSTILLTCHTRVSQTGERERAGTAEIADAPRRRVSTESRRRSRRRRQPSRCSAPTTTTIHHALQRRVFFVRT